MQPDYSNFCYRGMGALLAAWVATSASASGEAVSSPNGRIFIRTLAFERREDLKVERTIPLIATKAANATDHYHSATFTFRETTAAARRLLVDVRTYDDGVAFRYRIDDPAPVPLRQALAMCVVYDSPLQMVSDDPDAYQDAAGFGPTQSAQCDVSRCPQVESVFGRWGSGHARTVTTETCGLD